MPLISYNKSAFRLWRHPRVAQYVTLTALLFFFNIMHSLAAGGQQTITLSVNNVPLEKVFKEIQKQSGYSFIYTRELLQDTKPVSIKISNVHIDEAISLCLKEQPVTFVVVDKMVIIKPKATLQSTSINKQSIINADPGDISGRVTDEYGKPLAGANVKIKGTMVGTTTDKDGNFTLFNVDENASLEISYVGHETQVMQVKGKAFFVINLGLKLSLLDETVVIAYGQTTKRLATGNISSVKASEIERQPINNPILALAGRVTGLYITQNSGLPGGGITVRIQGQNSMFAGNDPLYVVDGVPFVSQTLATASVGMSLLQNSSPSSYQNGGAGNPLSFINPSDIESIEVLKDADATSIYGSRAANGAILITTKKGKVGPSRLNINYQQGWQTVSKTMRMMNTDQYLEMRKEAMTNDNLSATPYDYDLTLWDQSKNTDWVKTFLKGTGKFNNINASMTGGNSNIQYLIGATYQKETTVFSNNFDDKKVGIHFNLNSSSANQKFKVQLTGSFLTDKNLLPSVDLTSIAYSLPPNAPDLYNEDGTLNWAQDADGNSSWINPMSYYLNKYENKTDNLNTNATLTYSFLRDLEMSTRLGYTKLQTNEFASSSILSVNPETRPRFLRDAQYSDNRTKIFSIEPQLNYKRQWKKLNFSAFVGTAIQQIISEGKNVTGTGYATDDLTKDIRSATKLAVNSTIDALYKYNAVFGTLSGNWENKYLININVRRDGSSHFAIENRFQNFASVGGAWIFSEENVFKKRSNILSFGKIKGSYGTSGNDQIGDYTYMDLYNSVSTPVLYQSLPSIRVTQLPSPYLQWEETKKLSVGLDLGFFNDRLFLTANFQRNSSSNQLMGYALPFIAGFQSVNRNFPATIRNDTWEFTVNTINIKSRSVEWKMSFNLTLPKNKLSKFPNLELSSYASSLSVGQPVNVLRAYRFAGVNPNTGIYQFVSKDGDTTSSPTFEDRTVFMDINPKFYGGIQNSFRYKNFELDVLFQFEKKIGPSLVFGGLLPPGVFNINQPFFLTERWQKPEDVKPVQRYNSDYSLYSPFSNAGQSDATYIDASYIRLKNISVSYEVPAKLIKALKLQNCKLYMHGQNLATITSYKGADPENTSFNLAPMRAWTAGIQIGF